MIRLAPDLELTDDLVTKTVGILAQRRKGKTYTATVIAEELVGAGVPFVALDPTGAWWGLRANAKGDGPGLPVTILGGQHGDVPLERTAGRLVAELVVDQPGWYILDLSLFESKEADRQFATDFAERLYRRKGQAGGDTPLHLFVDEADLFVPQQSPSGDKRMVGAFETLVRRGGIRGIGTTLISQRAAVVNKNVLEMLDMLVVLRTVGPNDRKAIDGYVSAYSTPEQRAELIGSLASLDIGEAWIWEPGEDLYQRARIRARRTFNSSATPKPGEQRVEPARLAAVDLDALKDAMADTIEKADQTDPKKLQARIAELERELHVVRDRGTPAPVVETIEVQVLDEDLVERLEAAIGAVADHGDLLVAAARDAHAELERLRHQVNATDSARATRPAPTAAATPVPRRPAPAAAPPAGEISGITGGARRILEALATYPDAGLTEAQTGTLAKLKRTGGTFSTYVSRLRTAGLITKHGNRLTITDTGLDHIGGARPPQDPAELQAHWRATLTGGARRMYDLLLDAYPSDLTREDLADAAGITQTGGTFGTYLSRLRSNGLIEEPHGTTVRAHPDLFLGNGA